MARGVRIRAALVHDAPAVAACHIACWREAYASIVAPDLLAQRTSDLAERTERWRHIIETSPPRWLGVEDEENVVGFAAAGAGRDDDLDIDTELYAIYVRASHYGTGLADRLIDSALGRTQAYLWVFEGNPRARSFYARHGFVPDGARKLFCDAPEIRMLRTAKHDDGG
ncbi:MAG: GNAT family N-acetyltransferase [Nocardioidaceae bacterium]